AHGDAVLAEGPDLFDQAVVELALPFAGQEGLDLLASAQELRAVAPEAVDRIGLRDAHGIAGGPGVFRHARLLRGSLLGGRRQRRSVHGRLLNVRSLWSWIPKFACACGTFGCELRNPGPLATL